jgi:hypothetical protein
MRRSSSSLQESRASRGAAAALLVMAAAFALGAPAGEGSSGNAAAAYKRCRPLGSVTVASSARARVYQLSPGRKKTLWGCAYSVGREFRLADPNEGAYAFPSPAVRVTGPIVAFAWDDQEGDATWVSVVDIRHNPLERVSPNSGAPAKAGGGAGYVKVGSLQLGASGTVAWISCPEDPDKGNPTASQHPGCEHPGRRDSVWVLPHDAQPRAKVRLARGRSIDPSSLDREGRRYCWRQGGHARCERLP